MKTRLTKSELAVMEVLWDEGEALTSAEIIQKSKEKEWKDSSVHLLINSLLKKKVVDAIVPIKQTAAQPLYNIFLYVMIDIILLDC